MLSGVQNIQYKVLGIHYIGGVKLMRFVCSSKSGLSLQEVSVFLFDKIACNKLKQRKTILSAAWKHVDLIQTIQKYNGITLRILLMAKENRYTVILHISERDAEWIFLGVAK